MTEVIGIGAGGHSKVVLEVLQARADVRVTGFVDRNPSLWGTQHMGIPVLGADDILPDLFRRGVRAVFIGLGATERSSVRRNLYNWAIANGFDVVSCIHSTAVISPSAKIG